MNSEKNQRNDYSTLSDTEQADGLNTLENSLPPKSLPWKKIIEIFGIIVFIFFLGYVLTNLNPPPDPDSSDLVNKRSEAISLIQSSFDQIDNSIGFRNYADATHDICYEGQNNWKVKDGFDHRCEYKLTKFYGFNDDFRQKMTELDKSLTDEGWLVSYGLTMNEILQDYDLYYRTDKSKQRYFQENYLVSDLPRPQYINDQHKLNIEYVQRETDRESLLFLEDIQRISAISLTYEEKNFQNTYSIFDEITEDNEFVIAVSIQQNYFEN